MAFCLVTHSTISPGTGITSSAAIAAAGRRSNGCVSLSSSIRAASSSLSSAAAATVVASRAELELRGVRRRISQHHSSPYWGAFGADRSNSSPVLLFCPCLRAKRKTRGGDASQAEEAEEDLDEDLRVGLNEISTEALKAMLSEDDKIVAELREKVEYIGEYLVQENQLDAARFMIVVIGMLDHEVVPQKDDLKGAYKKAFDKIFSVIEDSGWVLKQEGADVGGVEMVDDELMPPVLNTQY